MWIKIRIDEGGRGNKEKFTVTRVGDSRALCCGICLFFYIQTVEFLFCVSHLATLTSHGRQKRRPKTGRR